MLGGKKIDFSNRKIRLYRSADITSDFKTSRQIIFLVSKITVGFQFGIRTKTPGFYFELQWITFWIPSNSILGCKNHFN